jgi:hypothetical protein
MTLPKLPPDECPVCGAAVPPQARACPECGADERSGWDEDATGYDGLDLPESAWEPDDDTDDTERPPLLRRPRRRALPRPNNLHPFWWLTAAVLLVLVAIAFVVGFW